jgi:hypothetical protein
LKIGRVDMATGTVNTAWLGMGSILPPRIDFSEDGVVVLGQRVASSGQAPRWIARRAQWTGKSFSLKSLDFGNLDDAPAENGTRLVLADFDFACRHNLTAADQCVLVAPLFDESDLSFQVGSVSSRQFSVTNAGKVTMAGAWTHTSDIRATAVTGVSIAPGPTLIVSTSRRSANASSINSLLREYRGYSVSTVQDSLAHRSDINTNCENATVNGVQIGAATPHGGVSLDWCARCGGGRIETLQFNREVGDTAGAFCF